MRFRDLSCGAWGVGVFLILACLGGCDTGPATLQSDPRTVAIDAKHVLLSAADDKDEFTRAEAIEALGAAMGKSCGNTYIQALQDPSPVVRFAAAIVLGDLKYEPAKPILLRLSAFAADGEPDKRVFAAIVYALYRMGNMDHTRELGPLLFDAEWEVRANVALVMGKMGNPKAVAPLKALRATERTAAVQIQLKDSLAMLGDMGSLEQIESYARSSIYLDERVPAIQAVGNLRDRRGAYLLRNMIRSQEPPLVRLAAAGAMAQVGVYKSDAYEYCIRVLRDPVEVLSMSDKIEVKPEDASKAATLAAVSLGYMGNVAAVDTLKLSLGTPDGQVRVAAAKSILLLLANYREPALKTPKPQPTVKPEPPKPTPPTTKPVTPVIPPATKPVPPTTKPVPPATKPTPPTTKPVVPVIPPATKPVPSATKPVVPVVTPVTPPVKPVTPATKPAPPAEKPVPATKPAEKPSTTRPKLITAGAKD